ncbi:hypothetical protein F1737_08585 [Methanoplanus sp. FWC-SCC4]|uniref:Uncharacterized protein n=1 Tax=Methanochimaera problematica TaxID=2609417 RepID=A0AA97FDW3_9EURY|nr:hypothetical protein [Methanoplanus sp. FWC-SCC4]WOF16742.1 hypothetical protein F1737_08585 [Methanoplanus sp. FWC-SCC4]
MANWTIKSALREYDRKYRKDEGNPAKRKIDRIILSLYILGENGRKNVSQQDIERKAAISKKEIIPAIEESMEKGWIIDSSTMSGMKWTLNRKGIIYAEEIIETLESVENRFYLTEME